MSDTPRTDAEWKECDGKRIRRGFASQLERELNDAKRDAAKFSEVISEIADALDLPTGATHRDVVETVAERVAFRSGIDRQLERELSTATDRIADAADILRDLLKFMPPYGRATERNLAKRALETLTGTSDE